MPGLNTYSSARKGLRDRHGQLEAARNVGFEIRNPQRFVHNLARLVEETGRAATVFMKPHIITGHFTLPHDLAPMFRTLVWVERSRLAIPHPARVWPNPRHGYKVWPSPGTCFETLFLVFTLSVRAAADVPRAAAFEPRTAGLGP
jgi:hypothetical protein